MPRTGSALGHFFWQFCSYHVQRAQLLASFTHRLLVLACVSTGCVTAGALLYYVVSGEPLVACLFKSYGVMFRAPGFVVSQEQTLAATLVLNTMFIFSVFVFATLMGLVGDEVKQSIQAMRNGDVPLQLRGHTLVLNWNSLTLSLLRQLHHAQHDPKHCLYQRPVVVLADRPKAEMDAVVLATMKGLKFEVFLRSGRPSRQPDLQRVAAVSAGTVLLLQPEPCSSEAAAEALKATTLISLRALQLTQTPSSLPFNTSLSPSHLAGAAWQQISSWCSSAGNSSSKGLRSKTGASAAAAVAAAAAMRVVVQVPQLPRDDDLLGFLHSTTAGVSKVQGARLLSQRMLDRLVAQTAVQPGVGQAFREIVRAGADAAQLCWCDAAAAAQLEGSRFRQARQVFAHAVVLGVLVAADGELVLNPPDEMRLAAGDRLLGFTRQATLHPTAAGSTTTSSSSSSRWRYLGRSFSRANSMASNNLHMVPSNNSVSSLTCLDSDSTPRYLRPRTIKVIVLGWPEAAVDQLLSSLQETAPEGSCFTFLHSSTQQQTGSARHAGIMTAMAGAAAASVSSVGTAALSSQPLSPLRQQQHHDPQLEEQEQHHDQEQQQEQQPRVTLRHMHVPEPCSVSALTAAGIADADAVIIGGALAPVHSHHTCRMAGGGLSCTCEGDAMAVAALLTLQQALQLTASQ
ncbi:hypothetical protein COO60DRAFT_1622239, partial [Scenedesmus sp. NREL 46B-D3]